MIWNGTDMKLPTLQAREEVRLTHFYYSEWPGGVEEGEQVLLMMIEEDIDEMVMIMFNQCPKSMSCRYQHNIK